ncbi:MAG: hypothetical protein AB1349_14395, partial [Elusimicrobiota bacterium]
DRKLEPEWLDFFMGKILENKTEKEIRKEIDQYLSEYLKGKEAISKTVTVIMRIVFSQDSYKQELINIAKELVKEISSEERVWLYWGLLLLTYPFVKDIAEVTGRLLDLQGSATISDIKTRIVKEWGDRETVRRMVQMVTKTMENFGFIKDISKSNTMIFEKASSKRKTKNLKLSIWFTEVVIMAANVDMISFDEIKSKHFIFPFDLQISITEIYKSERLSVQREGDIVLVGVRGL